MLIVAVTAVIASIFTFPTICYGQEMDMQEFYDAIGFTPIKWPEGAVNTFEAYIQHRPSEQERYAIVAINGIMLSFVIRKAFILN